MKNMMKDYFTAAEMSQLYGEVDRGLKDHPSAKEAADKLKVEKGKKRLAFVRSWRSNSSIQMTGATTW